MLQKNLFSLRKIFQKKWSRLVKSLLNLYSLHMKNKTILMLAFSCLTAVACLTEAETPVIPEDTVSDETLMTKLTGAHSAEHMPANSERNLQETSSETSC